MDGSWQPLSSLASRWQANLNALRTRDPFLGQIIEQFKPRAQYVVAVARDRIDLGRRQEAKIEPIAASVPPASAQQIAAKLYPSSACTEPVMVAGIDQGWLWQTIYQLGCSTPYTPGHRPPLYFLERDPERLWIAMHLFDWVKLLADPRVRLFIGADAVAQCQKSMIENTHIPWAKLCVTVDQSIWPSGVSVDSLWQRAHQAANERMQQLTRQIDALYAGLDVKSIARRMRGEKLRVMGITSHYTTFLKYSMSDWLDAMDAMGHETKLVIEQADHELANPIFFADAVIQFRPDLILMLDHYRGELAGLPRQIPCVMWVQDHLPNIFNAKAGAAQGPRDYCLGFGRLNLQSFGYPQQRFMPAQVGVNEARFAPTVLSDRELSAHRCDVSFVSHASTPATVILTEQISRADPMGRKLLIDIFEQMRGIYDTGGTITQPLLIRRMIDDACNSLRFTLDEPSRRQLLDFFNQRVNNALFRHQTLTWLSEMDINLHLYGRGWEQHPKFAPFARGIACNQTQLCSIYQASRINMQITPFGAVHQRLFEGLAAGGFFLLRYCPGDAIETIYKQLFEWCRSNGIETEADLQSKATGEIRAMLNRASEMVTVDQFATGWNLMDVLKLSADGDYIRSAQTVWGEDYAKVAFNSRDELKQRVSHFLANDAQRRQIADSMRRVVLERFTYRSITSRLLDFVADDLARDVTRVVAAA